MNCREWVKFNIAIFKDKGCRYIVGLSLFSRQHTKNVQAPLGMDQARQSVDKNLTLFQPQAYIYAQGLHKSIRFFI